MKKELYRNPFIAFFLLIVFCLVFESMTIIFALLVFCFQNIAASFLLMAIFVNIILLIASSIYRNYKAKLLKISFIFLVIPCFLLISVFVSSFNFCYASNHLNLRFISEKFRFPLTKIEKISVNKSGYIFALSRVFNRLQVFDKEGEFIRGWFVQIQDPSYDLYTDEGDHIVLATEQPPKIITYNVAGQILLEKRIGNEDEFNKNAHSTKRDALGNTFKASPEISPNKIIKTSRNGKQQVIVRDTWGLWLYNPTRSLFFCALMIVVNILYRLGMHKFIGT
jgi:hypothetical protein